MPGTTTERRIVQLLNDHYDTNEIDAYAHRLKMGGYSPQHLDVLSLSSNQRYYLGIECKSALNKDINGREFTILYFSRYFHKDSGGVSQVTSTTEYLTKCGLTGYMAFELRGGRGSKNHIYFVPFEVVDECYNEGRSGMTIEEIAEYPDILDVGVEGVL